MPGDDGFRFDDDERGALREPGARQPGPEPPVRVRESHPTRLRPLKNLQLVTQGEHLKMECRARPCESPERL